MIIHFLPKLVTFSLSIAVIIGTQEGKSMPSKILVPLWGRAWLIVSPGFSFYLGPFLRIHGRINQIPHTVQTFKNNEWMRISVSFGLVTDCCVTNYPKAHHLNNKHLSFLIVSVVCEFDRKLDGQLSRGLSQEVESEENQDCSPLKSLFRLEGVGKTACSQGWQIRTACW